MTKPHFLLFLITILFTSSGKSQKIIDLKAGYLPNLEYTLTQTQISENVITYIADDVVLQNLKNNGIENPTVIKDTSFLKSFSKTGNLNGNSFFFDLEILESDNDNLISGTKFYGESVNRKIRMDSITSPSNLFSEEDKEIILSTIQSILDQITIPEKKIKAGDNFEQDDTLLLPIADVAIEIDIKSIYTLKKIKKGIGYFDINQIFTFKSASKGYEIKIDGIGNGYTNYDIEKEFFTELYLDTNVYLLTELDDFSIELQSHSIFEQTTEIIKAEN